MIQEVLQNKDTLVVLVLGGVGLCWIIAGTIASVMKTSQRERSRREIAAYVAEGSMTPEHADRPQHVGHVRGKRLDIQTLVLGGRDNPQGDEINHKTDPGDEEHP